ANASAFAAYHHLLQRRLPEIEDLVPGARTLLVVLKPDREPSAVLLQSLERTSIPTYRADATVHEIPVRYGGDEGRDLVEVAQLHGMTEDEVISRHSGASYVVGFTGFSPGFPYLFGMPEILATPRLATPRTRIPSGSVGIGGSYTGIYPQATAGGWRLIGRTDLALFDAGRDPPALLLPGAAVRFLPT
ncbi:MAG: 5-oxoprolinase subunit PxpB, partial [Actinomycetota bacterium]